MRSWRGLLVVSLAMGLVAAGCGGDKKDTADATTTTAAPKDAPVFEIHATEAGAKDFKFALPTGLTGGAVTLKFINDGKAPHDFQLIKATPGHTPDEIKKELASEEAPLSPWIEAIGGVGTTGPGQTKEATLDIEPGNY